MIRVLASTLLVFLAVTAAGFALWRVSRSRSFQFFGGLLRRVETEKKAVALTFDDGPAGNAPSVLAELDALNVKATFFVTGAELEKEPAMGRRIVASGHELGNHTYSHQRMVFKSLSFIRDEIERTDRLIRGAGYDGPIHFRPPGSKKLFLLPYYLRRQGRKTIMCDLEPDSYPEIASDAGRITAYVKENARPGSIILLHVMYDSRRESLRAVAGIVGVMREMGFEFRTVSELMENGTSTGNGAHSPRIPTALPG